jgi:hypothetical protein
MAPRHASRAAATRRLHLRDACCTSERACERAASVTAMQLRVAVAIMRHSRCAAAWTRMRAWMDRRRV